MDGERDCSRKQRPKHEQWIESNVRVLVVRDILTHTPTLSNIGVLGPSFCCDYIYIPDWLTSFTFLFFYPLQNAIPYFLCSFSQFRGWLDRALKEQGASRYGGSFLLRDCPRHDRTNFRGIVKERTIE